MVKPGCELNNLLESANSASGSLTQKDVIFICGGSNDFNFDNDELITDHILEFIKSNNHTNIVLANVPIHYDLSYYSKVNEGIRSYNKKLMEITKEHKQVALIETDRDRKYHTRHGLHFNTLGKLLFSNKTTQAIYSILSNKLKQSTIMNEKYGIQEDESEVDGRNGNQGHKDFTNSEGTIKLIQNVVDSNSEERLNQNEDETTSDNSDDKNDGQFGQIKCDMKVNEAKTVFLEQAQNITDNTQSESVDKITDIHRISTRNKKTPSIRSNYFLW